MAGDGNSYAFLGGFNNVDATLEQDLSVPSGSANPTLTFWVNVVTNERSTAGAKDRLAVEIRDSSGALLATPLTLDNRDARRSNNTRGQYFEPHAIDMAPFAGRQIKLIFHVTTDRARSTTFRLDDVFARQLAVR